MENLLSNARGRCKCFIRVQNISAVFVETIERQSLGQHRGHLRAYLRLFHREVGAEEAREIAKNITGFFLDILAEWSGTASSSAQARAGEAPDLSANDTEEKAR